MAIKFNIDKSNPKLLGGLIDYCTGCRACEQICGHSAITMLPNEEGFLESITDFDKCVDCNLCRLVCPQNLKSKLHEPIMYLAVRDKNDEEISVSASGGAFAAAARVILSRGGVVVGAAYNDDLSVSHHIIDDLYDLPQLQSSKYVQSNTEETFKAVKERLSNGKTVLYSGVPCQIAGLKGFLRKDYDNLFTMDVICHGVASPKLFAKYIEWLGGKMKGRIIYYDFRDKSSGWGLDYMTKTMTKTKTKTCSLDPYYYHFLAGDTYRECCYNCLYSRKERVSDITIGDYWGIEKEHPSFYSTKGVSCMLVNTEKGERLWNMISSEFVSLKSTFDQIARANHNLKAPTNRPDVRDSIYDGIDILPVNEYIATKLVVPFNVKAHIKELVPKWVKVVIKRYIYTGHPDEDAQYRVGGRS